MKIRSGELRTWVRVEAPLPAKDSFGAVVRTWPMVFETWARVRNKQGFQSEKADKPTHTSDVEVLIRVQDVPVTTEMRVVIEAKTHRIVSIDDGEYRGEYLLMIVKRDE